MLTRRWFESMRPFFLIAEPWCYLLILSSFGVAEVDVLQLSSSTVIRCRMCLREFFEVDSTLQITDLKLSGVPTSILEIAGAQYKTQAAILHMGENTSSGHYIAYLRQGTSNWVCANDTIVAEKRWPNNSKDVYVIILKRMQGSPIVFKKTYLTEINVKLIIEKNNKFLIINEYKNKFMNKEEENSYSENESNSSEEETDKTNTTETQVELNKNIEIEKLVEISINTKEDSDSTQRINREKPKEKSLQNISKRKIKKINLKAINDKIVTTIGKIIIILLLNNNKIKTEFHVVDKEFPIPRDGILGHHFLLQNNAIIDKQELIQEQRIELNVIKEIVEVQLKCIMFVFVQLIG
ncbi:hypothetical protein AGLY_017538 [Aphis glycines]|uniref:USP domain-containing protein n=1 Tax=Aphis glycines TaxID=307491 RepID=A0A6G0SVE0_APHGL|nr:hypothetical protein AGLY_017538 [Aphis glycines]